MSYGPAELTALYSEEVRLRQLHRWLTYEGLGGTLACLAFVIPYGIVFTVLMWAAVLFTPYLVWRLLQLQRYGWIVGFGIAVIVPFVWSLVVRSPGFSGFIASTLPLATFYAYTWLLRHTVEEWLGELHWKRQVPR